jgi:hypothetical protein
MVYGATGAHQEELKEKRLLSLPTELRSYRPIGSGMNKIVRSNIVYSVKHQEEQRTCSDLLRRFRLTSRTRSNVA